ncbi:MAG: hypothetical protein U9Q06_04585 [Nanoarchaeota archaeon]|nr:hypothetical protein [Nanoarchaeota archaeon]
MVKNKKESVKNPWFKKSVESKGAEWGLVPINWKGWVALVLLIGLNIFSANYFQINKFDINSWSKFGIVFLISLFVFIMIARRKTYGIKVKKR